jgi:alternate signal-mediated exported protein
MSLSKPFAVAVVGALLVGGATTGTTLALWHDQAAVDNGELGSGAIVLQVDGRTTAEFAPINGLALNAGASPGSAQTFTATLKNGSSGTNMRMRMHLDDVTTPNGNLNNGLEIALSSAAQTGDCAMATTGYAPLSAPNSMEFSTAGVPNGGTRALCVSLRVKASAAPDVASQTGTLTFLFRGEQVRP